MAGPARLTPTGLQPGSAESFSTFISGVPAAKTPFTGSERVPLVQNGFTVYAPPGGSGFGPPVRTILTANTNFYVAVTGNDSNPGTLASPWATLQHAFDFTSRNIDAAGFDVIINLGAGTFASATASVYPLNAAHFNVLGAGAASTTIKDLAFFGTFPGAAAQIDGVTCLDTGGGAAGGAALYSQLAGTLNIAYNAVGVTLDGGSAAGYAHLYMFGSGVNVGVSTPLTIKNNAAQAFFVDTSCALFIGGSGGGLTVSGTPAFSGAFLQADGQGVVSISNTWTGAATGKRFNIISGAVVFSTSGSGALGPNWAPGNSAGTVDASSSYDGFQGPLPGIDTQTGAAYTLAITDTLGIVEMNNAGANTLTVPTNASVAFDIGTKIWVTQTGAGATTIAGAGGVTVDNAGVVGGQWKSVKLYKRGTDEWVQTNA